MTADDSSNVKSRPISRRLRFEILRRDNYTCRYCGGSAPDVTLTVDHVVPVALGGSDDPSNLVTACKDCNSGKSSTSPDEHVVADVASLAIEMASALEVVAARRREDSARQAEALAAFDDVWRSWNAGGNPIPRAHEWRNSISAMASRGLSADDFKRYVGIAMRGPADVGEKWRYFCGCCWKELSTREELARQMVEQQRAASKPTEWYSDPLCEMCDGEGFTSNGGSYERCPCLSRTPYEYGAF